MNNKSRIQWVVGWVGLGLAATALAQTADGDQDPTLQRDGQELTAQVQTRTQTQTEAQLQDAAPDGLDREQVTQRIRERLQDFEQKRLEYIKRMEAQQRALKGANEAQREQVRQRIREQRQEWLRLAQSLRERARTRVQEMKDALPSHQEMLDQARDQLRDRVREVRERRVGVD